MQHVYIPTWENVFALFEQLAQQATIAPEQQGEYAPERLFFRSQARQHFVLGFPDTGKERIKSAGYVAVKATGGADWEYRELLEKKLSIFEHFRGNGRTLNEIEDPNGENMDAGLLETDAHRQ